MDALGSRPPRVTITELASGESLIAQFNPRTLREALDVKYQALEHLGATSQIQQWQHTGSLVLDGLEFRFDALAEHYGADGLEQARKRLHAWCYPAQDRQTVQGGGPPLLRFFWPNLLACSARIHKLEIEHQRFSQRELRSTLMVATMTIKEEPSQAITRESIWARGWVR